MRERVVNVRVSPEGLDAFDARCEERGVRRSVAFREAMLLWMRPSSPARLPVATGANDLLPDVRQISKADAAELRQWRAFADRTAIHGDPTRQVTPGIEMSGWTFVVIPQRDEHLEIA